MKSIPLRFMLLAWAGWWTDQQLAALT